MDEQMTRLLPSGLATALVAGEQRRIFSISENKLALLSAEAPPKDAEIRLCVYRFDRAEYEEHALQGARLLRSEAAQGGVLSLYQVEDAEYARLVRFICRDYTRYVRLSQQDALPTLVSYPLEKDDVFPDSLAQAAREALHGLSFSVEAPFELALSLDRPSLYARFWREDAQTLLRDLLCERSLDGHALFKRPLQRVYLGCAVCEHRTPDRSLFCDLIERAQAQGLSVTCVLPCLRPGREESAEALIALCCAHSCEIMASDWGMLQLCSGKTDRILIGPLLNRRRRDPRVFYQNGAQKAASLRAQNALNDLQWLDFLLKMGVSRFEHETCGYPFTLPPGGRHSLHLPWYQTNVSSYCPLRACLKTGDREKQTPVSSCDFPCERATLAYPAHLNAFLTGTAIWALDRGILEAPEPLHALLLQGVDRLVVNWP